MSAAIVGTSTARSWPGSSAVDNDAAARTTGAQVLLVAPGAGRSEQRRGSMVNAASGGDGKGKSGEDGRSEGAVGL